MAESISTRVKSAWNAFFNGDELQRSLWGSESSYGGRHDRSRLTMGNERSIVGSIYTRMSLDVAAAKLYHVKVDDDERYINTMKSSGLHDCLSSSANIDQTSQAFLQDAALTLFDKGVIAIVPVDTTRDPRDSDAYDVNSLRVGTIKHWFPRHVRVDLYNDRTGKHQEITLPKTSVAIVENPFFNVMNAPNGTLKRLIHKLNILDAIDEQSGSGKLDIIMKLPFLIKTEARRKQAEERRKALEDQLKDSKYGVGYVDATEQVTQLNRPIENNLMEQIKFLTDFLFSQLGLTTGILDGSADEKTMVNYQRRTIEPIVEAIATSMQRTFISKTARTQGQRIMMFVDRFKLVTLSDFADAADKLSRNKIATANELRGVMGWKPSSDSSADKLVNSNMPLDKQLGPEGGMDVNG